MLQLPKALCKAQSLPSRCATRGGSVICFMQRTRIQTNPVMLDPALAHFSRRWVVTHKAWSTTKIIVKRLGLVLGVLKQDAWYWLPGAFRDSLNNCQIIFHKHFLEVLFPNNVRLLQRRQTLYSWTQNFCKRKGSADSSVNALDTLLL